LSSSNGTSNSIIAEYKGVNAISGIKSTTCYYGTSSNPTTTGTVSESKCIFTNLNSNTTYYFKQCITTNARNNVCSNKNQLLTAGGVYAYDYTGKEQTLTIPVNGTYKLETWGAQGGSYSSTYPGGYGAYSYGNIQLNKNDILYITAGGAGSYLQSANVAAIPYDGGHNGGGKGCHGGDLNAATYGFIDGGGSGGGATHIATKSGLLTSLENYKSSILIVSGAGGGASYSSYGLYGARSGGSGGGIEGNKGTAIYTTSYSNGGTQTSGGAFGAGGWRTLWSTGGAGGGYYGGTYANSHSGSGGSGYIGNSSLTNKGMYCYNCTASTATDTKTTSTTCTSSAPTANCAKQGNGYAKITILSTSN